MKADSPKRLRHFVENILPRYDELRSEPSVDGTTRLSSYLHFGFLSAHEVVVAVNGSDAPQSAKDSAAQSYDALWDATQRELLRTGEIHNYAHMLWGKRVIDWCATYEEAFELLEHMNNKYALDGRNPNSYAGILWCFGKHDRAWGQSARSSASSAT